MSDKILISTVGLYETVKCTICKNPNQTERGCDGSCQYDEELHTKIVKAVEGIAEQPPQGEWKYNPDCVNDEMQATFFCSICNRGAYSKHDNFCPNCGADMREGKTK